MIANDYNPSVLIGLTGVAGSGKTTAATLLVESVPNVAEVRLSDPLKSMLEVLLNEYFGHPVDWNDREWKEAPLFHVPGNPSPRKLAQTLGTDWGREIIHPNLWVEATSAEIRRQMALHQDVVVSDVRFDNEAKMIKDLGGYVIQIERDAAPSVEAHSSENGVSLNLIDAVVYNNGEPEEMAESILLAIYQLQNNKMEKLYS